MKTIEMFLKSHKIIKVIVSNETDINLARIKNYDVINIHGAKNCSFDTEMIQVIDVIKQDDNDFCKDMSEIAFANRNEQLLHDSKKMKGVTDNIEENPELIIRRPEQGRYTYIDDKDSDKGKEIFKDLQNNAQYLIQENLQKQMERLQPNLNIPLVKR